LPPLVEVVGVCVGGAAGFAVVGDGADEVESQPAATTVASVTARTRARRVIVSISGS
jgi:hypothetical protein